MSIEKDRRRERRLSAKRSLAEIDSMLNAIKTFEATCGGGSPNKDLPEFTKAWEIMKDQLCIWRLTSTCSR
jgi:hypothetical protein